MGRIQTELKGVTTGAVYEDGDMYSLVNLRRKGGALRPVAPHRVERTLRERYDVYFIHRNEDWEHWIGVRWGEGVSDVFWDIDADDAGDIQTMTSGVAGRIHSVEQNGNMLIFVTDEALYYALFRNGSYTWYGELPDLIPIEWNCLEEHELYDTASQRGLSFYEGIGVPNTSNERVTDLQLLEWVIAMVNKSRAKLTREYLPPIALYNEDDGGFGGLFFDAFFVRYAYRLFDNTNVKLSPPILIMPFRSILDLMRTCLMFTEEVYYSYSRWQRFWNNFKTSVAVSEMGHFDSVVSRLFQVGFVPGIRYDLSVLSAFEGLIKGIDIFISPYIGISNPELMNTNVVVKDIGSGLLAGTEERIVMNIDDSMTKRVCDMSSFFLVKELKIGDTTNGNYIAFPEKTDLDTISNIRNLVHKEQLVDETQSVHSTGAHKSYMYNRRLHLADITMTWFGGFSLDFFKWERAAGIVPPTPCYNGGPPITYSSPVWSVDDDFIIETEIETGGGSGRVCSIAKARGLGNGVLSAMVSYPDKRAKRMTFYQRDNTTGDFYLIRSVELTEHEFLDIAYYLESDLNCIFVSPYGAPISGLDITGRYQLRSPSELRVSEVWNPLRVLNKNVLNVGAGRIMGIGSNVADVSERNYGQFPLLVFAEDGVYSLRVGEGDVAYSVVTQPALLDAPVSDVICQVPGGVVFAIARGLCLINGRGVTFLSRAVEERPVSLSFEASPAMSGALLNYGGEAFVDFLRGLTGMVYDCNRNEVVLLNDTSGFNWVLCLDDLSFFMTTEKVDNVVKNSTIQRCIRGLDVVDFSVEEGDAHVSLVTRPMTYGADDVKMMERMILRCTTYGLSGANGKRPVVITHRSNDGRNFLASKGFFVKEGNLKDIDTGMYGRTKFRQYTFSLGWVCAQDTAINVLESEVVKEYNNTKMR